MNGEWMGKQSEQDGAVDVGILGDEFSGRDL